MPTLPTPEGRAGDPATAALRRFRRTLLIDEPLLRLWRRAAKQGGARELATYAWALGAAPAEVAQAGPLVAARAYAEATALQADDPALQYGAGLASAGGFSRRRSLSLDSRRGFAAAARLDPDNLLPHLGVAAAKLSAGDHAAAVHALEAAAAAARFELYPSPVAELLAAHAPWLGARLAVLWPDRVADQLRYLIDGAARVSRQAGRKAADPGPYPPALERVARRMIELSPARPGEVLLAGSALMRVLQVKEGLTAVDAPAVPATDACVPMAAGLPPEVLGREAVGEVLAGYLVERRALGRRFEQAVLFELTVAYGGGLAGGLTALVGLVRSRRAWPPPWPLVVPGRTIAWLGAAMTVGSVLSVTVSNPAADAYRQAIETRLVDAEAELASAALARLRAWTSAAPE